MNTDDWRDIVSSAAVDLLKAAMTLDNSRALIYIIQAKEKLVEAIQEFNEEWKQDRDAVT